MKTKKNVEVLLENGIHFNTIMNLSDRQIGVLAERFFKSKPMGDIEQAKKDSLKSMKAFIKRYLGIENPDGLSYKEALEKMKMVARHAKSPNSNRITDLGAEVYRIAKDLDIPEDKKEETKEGVQTTRKTLEIQKFDSGTVNQMKQNNQGMNVKNGEVTPNKDGSLTVTREIGEKFESKAQQGLFWAKCKNSTGKKKKEWCDRAEEFSDKTTKKDYESMPEKKHPEKTVKKTTKKQTDESYERFLEERIFEMIERHVEPSMTKRDFIKSIQEKNNGSGNFMLENPKKNSMFAQDEGLEMKRPIGKLYSKEMKENTKEKERTTTKPGIKTPTRRKNPHKDPAPGVEEQPKADQKEKERTITKPGIKPKKKNPHRDPNPDVEENPKAENQKNQFMSIISTILNNN
jgi:hypothetical protein